MPDWYTVTSRTDIYQYLSQGHILDKGKQWHAVQQGYRWIRMKIAVSYKYIAIYWAYCLNTYQWDLCWSGPASLRIQFQTCILKILGIVRSFQVSQLRWAKQADCFGEILNLSYPQHTTKIKCVISIEQKTRGTIVIIVLYAFNSQITHKFSWWGCGDIE